MTSSRRLHRLFSAFRRFIKQVKIAVLTTAAAFPLVGSVGTTALEKVLEQGKLTVVSRNGPTTYYEGSNGNTGFEFNLLKGFADSLGVELEIIEQEDLNLLIDQVGKQGQFASAGLTITPKRKSRIEFTRPYMQVTQQVVYHTSEDRPKTVSDLVGKRIVVIEGSSHAERLHDLQGEYPDLVWEEHHDLEMLDLLEMVHNQKVDYAILDSNAIKMNSALYPRAQVAFDISEPENLAWGFPKSNDRSLIEAANKFLAEVEESGDLAELTDTYYGHLDEIDYPDALVFTKRMKNRLPKWKDDLQQAAESTNLDWLLLAALSYQESHWNPKAKSPTGVRGFMMLTLSTAKEMKVKNRLNAKQSIRGGSEYFQKLLKRIPESVVGQDRLWLALAAYNAGYGHLTDARLLAQQHGANPDKWSDVKEYFPLLTKRQYYKHTTHGYARGHEAVSYVRNIRNFYEILAWNEVERERLMQVASSDATQTVEEGSEFNAVISEVISKQSFAYEAM